jgi:hypothetical protein
MYLVFMILSWFAQIERQARERPIAASEQREWKSVARCLPTACWLPLK